MKRFFLILFVVALAITAGLFFSEYSNEFINLQKYTPEEEKEIIFNEEIESLSQGGWIPEWDVANGIESITNNPDSFKSISPFLYAAEKDGGLENLEKQNHNELFEVARENNILIIPSVIMFDVEILSSILNNEEYLEKHIQLITDKVVENDFDGIDLDYESIYEADGEKFFFMLEELKSRLSREDKLFSVTVLAKWDDNIDYPSFPQTRRVQDYTRISEIADELRIMAYDYTFQGSSRPGAIAPASWVEEVAIYSAIKANREKVFLGIPLYAYEWEYNPEDFKNVRPIDENEILSGTTARSFGYEGVLSILEKYEGENYYDTEIEENIFKYQKDSKDYVVFYHDTRSVNFRKSIAAKYGFAGVYYWRLGGENGIDF